MFIMCSVFLLQRLLHYYIKAMNLDYTVKSDVTFYQSHIGNYICVYTE